MIAKMLYSFHDIPEQIVHVIYQALGDMPLKVAGPAFSVLDAQKREQDSRSPGQAEQAALNRQDRRAGVWPM